MTERYYAKEICIEHVNGRNLIANGLQKGTPGAYSAYAGTNTSRRIKEMTVRCATAFRFAGGGESWV